MEFTIELASVQKGGALVVVEGEEWIVAIPFTLGDNIATIDTDELEHDIHTDPKTI